MGNAVTVLDEKTVFGNKVIRTGTISGAASYATSGDAIDWDSIMGMKVERVIIGSGGGIVYEPLISANLLKAFESGTASAPLDEVDSTDDLTSAVAQFIAIGRVS